MALVLSALNLFAQVGINTTTPNAQLDIRSGNPAAPSNADGILIPRIDAFPAVNPTAAQQGMMIYLTTAAGMKQPGFYYWDNVSSAWLGVGSGKSGWELQGNAGSDPATDFIGTTDNQPLAIKTNNTERMHFAANGSIGIGTANPLSKFHVFSGASGMTPNPFSLAAIEGNLSAYMSVLSAGETGVIFGANGNSTNGAIVYNNPSLPDGMLFRTNGNINRMIIGPTGNIGVGNSLPNARMEVTASSTAAPANTDGLIVPRINAFPAVNPTAAQNGMMVFLNTTVGAFKSGFYYWDNAIVSWKGIGSSGTPNDWGLAGNTGTNPTNNYIGTADDNDFIFKRNNIRAGLISTSNTGFGVNNVNPLTTGTKLTAVGVNTLRINSTGYENAAMGYGALEFNTTGFRNAAFGSGALHANTTGGYSTAVGNNALYNNVNGGSNTAIGDAAMINNIDGLFNVAVGNTALKDNIDADGNTAVGHRSMFMNTHGQYNTAVGVNSLYNNQATGIVGLGAQTLANNTTGEFNTATGSYALQANTTGGYNTANGYNALYNNTGSYNTAMGVNALASNTTASSVTAVGYAALYSNQTGINNNAVGAGALNRNTTGNNSTAMGAGALYWNNGDYNTGFGSNALVNNTTGYDNSASGAFSMVSNTTGIRNTAQGGAALNANTTGGYNVSSGYFALGSNQTGNNNTALGSYALLGNISGGDNTAIGRDALKSTTVSGGTAVGMQSLFSNVDGLYNTAVGMNALRANISGSYNTAMGYNALIVSKGNYNTAVGVNTLFSNNIGSSNTALGYRAMYHNVDAHYNTAVGDAALYSNTTGISNTAVGHLAMVQNATGSNNTVMGVNAVFSHTSGSDNTVVGHQGLASMATGSGNTVLGTGALFNQTAGDNNIAIGKNAAVASATGSNQLSVGNVIFGTGMDSGTTSKIGIGKMLPDAKLEVSASNPAAPANTDGMLVPRIGNFPLVNPTAAQNGMMIYLNNAVGLYATGFYYWDNASVSWLPVGAKTGWSTFGNSGTSPATHYVGTSDASDLSLRASGTEVMRLEVGGNVGIGTNNPTSKLEVNGYTRLGSTAPAIKTLKLTGTTNASQGAQTTVAHGLNSSKILGVNVLLEYSSGSSVPPNYGGSTGYEYDYYITATNITVWTKSGNSSQIVSKPFRILVTYEE